MTVPAGAQQPPPPAPSSASLPPQTPDPIAAALAPRAGGLTAEEAGKLAAKTKPNVRAKQEDLKVAAAKVDQALVGFFPRVSLTASYTRLSPVPGFGLGGGALVGAANAGPISANCDANGACTVVDSKGSPLAAQSVSFPVPLNSYSFQASLVVPVSDYVFRLSQSYASASHNEKAARLTAEAEALQAAVDGKVAYFNWVRARGSAVVASEAVEQAKAHVDDAKKSFSVGLASKADVLRIEAQLAAAQQSLAESQAFASIAEEQLRTVIGVPPDKHLEIGSDVMHEAASAPSETLQGLQDQALQRRLEIRSLDETVYSLKEVESLTKAGYLPRIDAFADAALSNPNQRVFPQTNKFYGTWDVGVRLSWTLNDTFTTIGAAAEAKARKNSVIEQKGALRDGLRIEVASAYADAAKAPPTIEAADRGLVAAEESLRVRRELFRNGKATSSELVDAEAELTRARLRRLDAHIGLLVARAKLDHASGRDVPARPAE
ncbi:outer membrane efflux protein [Minicystis rosea]|nr:outer membrane efflux protein [Minicystis rosea]